MKIKLLSLFLLIPLVLMLFPSAAQITDPFSLGAPQNLSVELKHDKSNASYFELKLDIPSIIKEIDTSLAENSGYYKGAYCNGLEIIFECKNSNNDWSEIIPENSTYSDYVTNFIKRGAYWTYKPYSEGKLLNTFSNSGSYSFRARFHAVWGEKPGSINKSIYSDYSNIATINASLDSTTGIDSNNQSGDNNVSENTDTSAESNVAVMANTNTRCDIFANISGIIGNSLSANHRNEIDVLSYKLKAASSVLPGSTNNSNAQFDTIKITKRLDRASAKLLDAFARGRHISSVVLTFEQPGKNTYTILKIILTDVLISSFNQDTSNSGIITEEIGLSFMNMDYQYYPIAVGGSSLDVIEANIDLNQD